jgi:endo-1,4-beta-xylanase
VTRRAALSNLAGLGLAGTAALAAPSRSAVAQPAGNFALELLPPLRDRSQASGIKYGCAAAAPNVHTDPIVLEKISTEANIFVPEAHLKWQFTEPHPGEFDFAAADSIADYAARHDMTVHGHTLVWYAANPDWVTRLDSAKDARAALERHISTLVTRYRGKIWAWDVVNEPVEPTEGLANGYRGSVWYRLLGIEHVDLAFQLARAADPKTPLGINDYAIEYTTVGNQRRRQALLALLRRLRDRNVPVDYLGLQSHLECHETLDRKELTAFLRSVVGLGYKLLITELDANDVKLRGDDAARDMAVERHVSEYLDIVFSVARPQSISTWGLTDRYTWMRQFFKRTDGTALRPLPLDVNLNRKRMWATLAKHLSA